MRKLNYRLIKVCYPTALIPINNFFLDILINNCGCPENHIPIYFLQSVNRNDNTFFFFNYSQALKEYKSKNGKENDNKNDENNIFTFKVEIDNTFNYSVDEITTYDFFEVASLNLPCDLQYENIETEIKHIIEQIKEDSFNIYEKVKEDNIILKDTLENLTSKSIDSKKMKFS